MLASSSLPFIDSILTSLGVPRDIRQGILADAKTDGGIDLDALLKGLQDLQKQSFFSNGSFNASSEEGNIGKLFEQLNLKGQNDGKSFSLADFIEALETRRQELKMISGTQASRMNTAAGPKNSGLQELVELLAAKSDQKGEPAPAGNGEKPAKSSDLVATLVKNLNLKTDGGKSGNAAPNGQGNAAQTHFSIMDLSKKQLNELLFSKQGNQDASANPKSGVDQKLAAIMEKVESAVSHKNGSDGIKAGESDGKAGLFKEGPQGGSRVSDTMAATNASDFKSADSAKYLSSLKAKPAANNLPNYVTNQIGKGLFKAVNNGDTELKLQLKPPELGRIVMKIDDAGGGMRVSVMAENHSARDILISHAHDLKATLANSGISLESFDVEMGKDFGQSMADARGQSGQSGKKGKNSGTGHEEGDPIGGDPAMDEGYSEATGSLHCVA